MNFDNLIFQFYQAYCFVFAVALAKSVKSIVVGKSHQLLLLS